MLTSGQGSDAKQNALHTVDAQLMGAQLDRAHKLCVLANLQQQKERILIDLVHVPAGDAVAGMDLIEPSKNSVSHVRDFVEEFVVNGKRILVLGEGRLINLAAAEGHPASVMDMSFANQALAAEYLVLQAGKLGNEVHKLPPAVDIQIATLKMAAMGAAFDTLTAEQQHYLASWDAGT